MSCRALLAAALLFTASTTLAAERTVVTRFGPVVGETTAGVAAFKGIPFAKPPVGALRWRAPQSPGTWTAPRPAKAYGPDCMQQPFPGDAAPLGVTPAEDCLYLNVWAPESAAKGKTKLPVMVWIYGGGFVNGGSSPPVYAGDAFARDGVILVSFNYRLGRFGFFAHPALSAENADGGLLGNYAYLDQIAALKWVRDNAEALGGDPDNVTIFGESAGGMSIHALLATPMANGLFQKAIIQSGAGRAGLFPIPKLRGVAGERTGEAVGVVFAEKAGIKGTDAAALAALRGLSAEQVTDGLNMASAFTQAYSGPMLDDRIFTREALLAYQAGEWAKVPLMIGATSADGFFFGGSRDQVFAPFGDKRKAAEAVYDPTGAGDIKVYGWQAAADRAMIEPVRLIAKTLSAQGAKVYPYRFSYVAESLRGALWGAPHATEIPFVFDTAEARYGQALTPADKAAAQLTHAYWVGFAKTGVPAAPGAPGLPAYDAAKDIILDITAEGAKVGPDPQKARLDLVEETSPK